MKTKLSVFAEKIIEAGWLVAVVAVPLFFNIYTARTFEPDKITLLRSVVMVMIGLREVRRMISFSEITGESIIAMRKVSSSLV